MYEEIEDRVRRLEENMPTEPTEAQLRREMIHALLSCAEYRVDNGQLTEAAQKLVGFIINGPGDKAAL